MTKPRKKVRKPLYLENYLDIAEYSLKYEMSISSLRRRIRANVIPFEIYHGKYLLEDSRTVIDRAPIHFLGSRICSNLWKERALIAEQKLSEYLKQNKGV